MSNTAFSFTPPTAHEITSADDIAADDVFRVRIVAALRDVRAREKRVSSPELRLGDAANDSVRFPDLRPRG